MKALKTVTLANNISADVIIVIDQSGYIAHEIAKYRPRCIILVVTDSHRVARQCHLHRGILPVFYCPGTIFSIKHIILSVMLYSIVRHQYILPQLAI